ncbi:DoxX family protein [Streptomyces sp. NPDC092369]|uniref:DoxX family protein n=1 Tax=Streptomyces sp. NPDC092369 TaxID=3366015 RepID=UPI0037FBF5E8
MRTAQVITAVVLALVFLPLGVAKIAAARVMRQAAAHLGLSVGLYRVVGTLEVAGACGLLVGLVRSPLGVAAGTGLTLLMGAAAAAHLRHRDPVARALPAVILMLAAGANACLSAAC